MNKKRVTLIHTSPVMIPVFGELCSELLPKIDVVHMVDESLLRDIIRGNGLLKPTARRVVGHILSAADAGADFIMATCSSIGAAAELGRELVDVPVMRVDEPMGKLAVERGSRIGVVATLASTLNPTAELVRSLARARSENVEVTARLCEGAFSAVMSGDSATHDKIVESGIRELMGKVDVIVLAQASMARVVKGLPAAEMTVPVLSSPRPAIEHLATVL